jgi:hypothetical protein
MKIRSSLRMPPLFAPLGIVGVLPLPLVEPEASYAEPEFWYAAAAVSGAVLLIGLSVVLWLPGMKLDGDRLLVRAKYGWTLRKALEEGERWAIAGDHLCLQKRDGSLVKLRVPKWTVNRRDWAELEKTLPILDRL